MANKEKGNQLRDKHIKLLKKNPPSKDLKRLVKELSEPKAFSNFFKDWYKERNPNE